ncbi:hypothetical protein OCK74_17340 [Chitinophagaceae bacterium LB-8]|uniref:DUF4145 domain-containing protein n=1 Tax=Paraflavisolibacter caeni TaxID=2982496 RepID=A0A9X2XPB5_9BACT|nr:hypothetical protein [Paraflavisolibacter caeni]MCU7550888.1 hypothetical protein [Paraflavisolibacter caeni]
MQFEFVSDETFQTILERDYDELQRCLGSKAAKSVLILAGSIVEALLSDYFIENLPAGHTQATILNLALSNLLDLAENEGLISRSDKNLATVIKDYRNLIHPGREVRKNEQFDFETAELSFKILNLLIRKIERKYREKFGYTADDIMASLNEDWNYHSIYSSVITRLSIAEKNKLIDELVSQENKLKSKFVKFEGEFNYENTYENIEEVKSLVTELKPILKQETILSYLKELVHAVTSGHSLQALALYNLFHEDLHLLPEQEQEMVSIYMLSLYSDISENSSDLAVEKTYSTIGKYTKTEKGKDYLKSVCGFAIPHFGGAGVNYEFDVLEQILNSFSEAVKDEVLADLKAKLLPLENVPANIKKDFVEPAVKRGILSFE